MASKKKSQLIPTLGQDGTMETDDQAENHPARVRYTFSTPTVSAAVRHGCPYTTSSRTSGSPRVSRALKRGVESLVICCRRGCAGSLYSCGFPALLFVAVSGRSHSETRAGCIVSLTTPTRSSLKASRSVSSRSLAENVSRVFLASYFLR